ncbi:UDP-2,4-diacetamido-2,4,6-trideoxy-beta-L-altropyranose hydrolase [Paenibacillus ferrarius]|uniref:UDP-2,4-diacetamido-2,4, 6-trideoxy-beta-L-altropyranose hydrolase n=1 Tax=Paenibacillus ferrarius TaxID=1469647 RepID=UPI003D2BCF86
MGKILFYCEASWETGSGHVMRCITLANSLSRFNSEIVFLTNEGGKLVIEKFADFKYQIIITVQNFNISEEIKNLKETLGIDCFIWDSYKMSVDEVEIISQNIYSVIIDDVYLLPYYPSHLILNQNIYANKSRYVTAGYTEVLDGSDYVLLRESFSQLRNEKKEISATVKKLLLTFGGADDQNLTMRTLEWLESFNAYSLEVSAVLGSHYQFHEELKTLLSNNRFHQVTLFNNVTNMAVLLADQDVVISAGGSTLYELSCLGIPTISMITASNQEMLVQTFEANGMTISLGNCKDLNKEDFLNTFRNIINNRVVRRELSKASLKLVDGLGAIRVASHIIKRLKECTHA